MLFFAYAAISAASAQTEPPAAPTSHEPTKSSNETLSSTELDYPIDEKVKVKVEPCIANAVVDRLSEPSTITVVAPGASEVELFVIPVDAPYGGKAIDKPHVIGKDDKPSDGFRIHWTAKESEPYIKLFAVVRRKGSERKLRSRTYDFAMSGSRLDKRPDPVVPQPAAN